MVLSFIEKSNNFFKIIWQHQYKKGFIVLCTSNRVWAGVQHPNVPVNKHLHSWCLPSEALLGIFLKTWSLWLDLTSGAKSAGIWSTEDFSAPSAKGGDSGWHVYWEEAVITAALWWLRTAAPFCVLLNDLDETLS